MLANSISLEILIDKIQGITRGIYNGLFVRGKTFFDEIYGLISRVKVVSRLC